jgi:hypothetical protein
LPELAFLNEYARKTDNYLLRDHFIEILDFPFAGARMREFPPVDRRFVDRDIKKSIQNLRYYGLLEDTVSTEGWMLFKIPGEANI